MVTCDIQIEGGYCPNEMVHFGRWIGYCDKHLTEGKKQDKEKTFENEINPDLENGNMDYINNDPELADLLI